MSKDKASVIAEKLKKDIGEGKYGADSPLPSVRALMKKHGIARSTANRVLQHLVQTGFAECRIGSGMYPVVKKPITFAVILPETEKPFHAALCTGLANCAKKSGGGAIFTVMGEWRHPFVCSSLRSRENRGRILRAA